MPDQIISEIIQRLNNEKLGLDWYSGKRILVTGGAGFIGSWLVEALVSLGSEVYVVDNLWRGSLDNLKCPNGEYMIQLHKYFFQGDLREYQFAFTSCLRSKPELVFHLADIVAGIDFVFANEPFVFNTNVLINTNMISAVKQTDFTKMFVYVGTACSYPKHLQARAGGQPLMEDQIYPANPESAYGWSKLMGEYESTLLEKHTDMQVGILRLQNVYGPKSILEKKRSQVIPSLIRKAILHPDEEFIVWGSGRQARDFVFAGDVVDALLRMPLKGMSQGPINIGSAQETTIAELAKKIISISGKSIEIKLDTSKPDGDKGRSGNIEKARQLLGWDSTTRLEEGLKMTYNWAYGKIMNEKNHLDNSQ